MKKRSKLSAYKKYRENQITLAASHDDLLVLAKELVLAKDEEGLDLFWDDDEERFMRKFIEYTEMSAAC